MKKTAANNVTRSYAETLGLLWPASELERRERRIRRVLSLEQLLQLNQRVEELRAGSSPSALWELQLEATALCETLRLLWGRLLLRPRIKQQQEARVEAALFQATQQLAEQRQRLLARIAAILSQSWVELGEGATLADDEALDLIRNLLLAYDADLIERQREAGWALAQAQQRQQAGGTRA